MAREQSFLELGLRDRLAALAQSLDHGQSLLAIVRDADRPHRGRRLQRQPELERALRRAVEATAGDVPQRRRQRRSAPLDQAQDDWLVLAGVDSRIPDPEVDLDGAQDAREAQDPAALEPVAEGRGAVFVDAVCAVHGLDVQKTRRARIGEGREGGGSDAERDGGPEDRERLAAELVAGCGQG